MVFTRCHPNGKLPTIVDRHVGNVLATMVAHHRQAGNEPSRGIDFVIMGLSSLSGGEEINAWHFDRRIHFTNRPILKFGSIPCLRGKFLADGGNNIAAPDSACQYFLCCTGALCGAGYRCNFNAIECSITSPAH
jgi:hypothetical protein